MRRYINLSWRLKRICFDVPAAVSMIFTLMLIHVYLTGSSVTVRYELQSNMTGTTQVYWSVGEPLSETKQISREIFPKIRNKIKIDVAEKSPIKVLRIDPLITPGLFSIENIRLEFRASLLPLGSWGELILKPESATSAHQLKPRDAEKWESTGNDPHLMFELPPVSKKKIFLFNLLIGIVIVTSVVVVTTHVTSRVVSDIFRQPREYMTLWVGPLGIYGTFVILATSSSDFVDMVGYSRWVLCAVLGVWVLLYLLAGRGVVSGGFLHATAALLAIAIAVSPDVLFRLGALSNPLFTRFDSPLYQWQFNKTPIDNFVNSSLRYHEDFEAIEQLIVPGSYFLSDIATSYYVSAALPLYPVNVLPHHRYGFVWLSSREAHKFCDDNVTEGTIKRYLEGRAELHKKNELAPMRYLLLNTDSKNRHVTSMCLASHHEQIKAKLDAVVSPVYTGRFIDVYEFAIY